MKLMGDTNFISSFRELVHMLILDSLLGAIPQARHKFGIRLPNMLHLLQGMNDVVITPVLNFMTFPSVFSGHTLLMSMKKAPILALAAKT